MSKLFLTILVIILIGRGDVDVVLTVDGKPANTITASIK